MLFISKTLIENRLLGSGEFRGGALTTAQNFLGFMQFFGKFDKIVCWRPPPALEGRRPLLDLPLMGGSHN